MSKSAWVYLFSFLVMIAGIGVFIEGLIQHQSESALATNGIRVNGNVTRAAVRHSGTSSSRNSSGSQDDFFLYVDYPVEGVTNHAILECTLMALDTHPAGSSVEIIYDPKDPTVVRLGGNLNANSSGWTYYTSLLMFLFGGLIALYTKFNPGEINDPEDDPIPDSDSPPKGHWTGDPLSEDDPGNIPTH